MKKVILIAAFLLIASYSSIFTSKAYGFVLDLGLTYDWESHISNDLSTMGGFSGSVGFHKFITEQFALGALFAGHSFASPSSSNLGDTAGSLTATSYFGNLYYKTGYSGGSPYLFLDLGTNVNTFSPNQAYCSTFGSTNCTIPQMSTFGYILGVGMPLCSKEAERRNMFYYTCFGNFEIGWWGNSGTFDVQDNTGKKIGSISADLSALLMTLRIQVPLFE